MTAPVLVRDAAAGDIPAVARLLAGGAMRAEEDPLDLGSYLDAFEEISAAPPGVLLVADDRGEVVGTCQLIVFRHMQQRGGRCGEIESVFVADGRRGGGIGAALVAEAVSRARAAGCYRVQLTSNLARSGAHRFYRRLGFEESHAGFKLYL